MSQDSILYTALNTPIFEPNIMVPDPDPGDVLGDQSFGANPIICDQFIIKPSIDTDEVPMEEEDFVESSLQQADETEGSNDEISEPNEPAPPTKKKAKAPPKKYPTRKGETRYYCTEPECTYSSNNEQRLSRHLRGHRGLQPYACLMCDYATVNSQMIREHMFKHTGEKPYKCSQCDHRSASKKNLKMHESRHDPNNPNRCPCGFIGRGRASVRHARICTVINKTLKLKTLKCKVCEYHTTDDMAFNKHKKTHRLKCDKCGYTTLEIQKMRAHNVNCLSAEPVTTGGKFRCKICAWSSKLPQKILLHLIHHPKQEVDEGIVDISVLRTCGIMD